MPDDLAGAPKRRRGIPALKPEEPGLSAASTHDLTDDLRCELERFYRQPSSNAAGLDVAGVFHPLAQVGVDDPSLFPLYLGPVDHAGAAEEAALEGVFSGLLAKAGLEPDPPVLALLVNKARRLTDAHAAPVDARRVLSAAGRELANTEASVAVATLLDAVPAGARLLSASSQAPLHLLAQAASRQDALSREGHLENLQDLAARAARFLRGERFGAQEARRVELGNVRRERLGHALNTLQEYLATREPLEPRWLVHDGLHAVTGLEGLSGDGHESWRVLVRENPCAAAAGLFDREAEKCVEVAQAISRLELETAGVFETARHEAWLAAMGWEDLKASERQQLPLVVTLTSADQIARRGMAALSQLLRSGRPVQVVLTADPLQPMDGEPDGGRFEPLLFGLIHRRAVVQQSALAYPWHLARGIDRALDARRPGLHIVALGDLHQVQAAVAGRGHPLAFHDPDAGRGWVERLDLSGNPAHRDDWPSHGSDQGPAKDNLAMTFADAVLLDRGWSGHFQVVPDQLEDGLIPLAIALARGEREAGVPFIWCGVGDRPCRVAISRQLFIACRERLEIWRALQEMAGLRGR